MYEGPGRVSRDKRELQTNPVHPGRDLSALWVAANICAALSGLGWMFTLKNNLLTEVFFSSFSGMATKCVVDYSKHLL